MGRFAPCACGCLWFECSLGLLYMVFLWLIRARCLLEEMRVLRAACFTAEDQLLQSQIILWEGES